MSTNASFRIDPAAPAVPPMRIDRPNLNIGQPMVAAAQSEDWLQLQSSDLIQRLQAWSSDLDAREAQLNARAARQDHRERQFRLSEQDAAAELVEKQRAAERIAAEIRSQARRLAFGD